MVIDRRLKEESGRGTAIETDLLMLLTASNREHGSDNVLIVTPLTHGFAVL